MSRPLYRKIAKSIGEVNDAGFPFYLFALAGILLMRFIWPELIAIVGLRIGPIATFVALSALLKATVHFREGIERVQTKRDQWMLERNGCLPQLDYIRDLRKSLSRNTHSPSIVAHREHGSKILQLLSRRLRSTPVVIRLNVVHLAAFILKGLFEIQFYIVRMASSIHLAVVRAFDFLLSVLERMIRSFVQVFQHIVQYSLRIGLLFYQEIDRRWIRQRPAYQLIPIVIAHLLSWTTLFFLITLIVQPFKPLWATSFAFFLLPIVILLGGIWYLSFPVVRSSVEYALWSQPLHWHTQQFTALAIFLLQFFLVLSIIWAMKGFPGFAVIVVLAVVSVSAAAIDQINQLS